MRRLFARATVVFLVVAVLVGGISHPGYCNPEDAYRRIEETRRQIAELEKIARALEESIQVRADRIGQLEKELAETEAWLERLEERLAEAEQELQGKTAIFAERVRGAYINGKFSYLELLLESESFGELIIRAAYLARILRSDSSLIAAIKQEQADIAEKQITMAAQQEKKRDLRYQLERERINLQDQRREKEALLASAQRRLDSDLARVTPQAEIKPVYGVVIDNSAQARPQHGLSGASLIYEYEVEGRGTRYLALFAGFPTKVGPIRSARLHSAILALENNVHYIYASGGSDVLLKIKEWGVRNTNALFSAGFYRDSARRAPYNLYTNLSTLGRAAPSQEFVIRPAYLSRKGVPANEVSLSYHANYNIKYVYNREQGHYRRFINGSLYRDATGREIRARNIIIQQVPHGTDPAGRPYPNMIGEGKIDYYAQGEHFTGTWKKANSNAPTRFYYQDGREIERIYGQTWIQIVRPR